MSIPFQERPGRPGPSGQLCTAWVAQYTGRKRALTPRSLSRTVVRSRPWRHDGVDKDGKGPRILGRRNPQGDLYRPEKEVFSLPFLSSVAGCGLPGGPVVEPPAAASAHTTVRACVGGH